MKNDVKNEKFDRMEGNFPIKATGKNPMILRARVNRHMLVIKIVRDSHRDIIAG